MKHVFSVLLFFSVFRVVSQDTLSVQAMESKLETLLLDLRSAQSDEDKKIKNELFKKEMAEVLKKPEAFSHPFPTLKSVGFIDSPDKGIRIVNWNVEQADFSHRYYCFVIQHDKKKKEYNVTELKDKSFGMPSQPDDIISSDEWYGALYYKIIPVKKGSKTLYTVLGWDYNSSMSQLKLVDVIYFSGNSVKLGAAIFKVGKETKKRLFYEHSKKVTMYLSYEEDRKRIMMDHLSPETPSMKNFKSYYVPDLSYDALIYQNNKWVLHEDVIGVNSHDLEKKKTIYVKNERTGLVEEREIKNKWENPEDKEAPAGGSEHVAVTPETADARKKEEDEKGLKTDKRDKRDPSQLTTIGGSDKKWWQRKNK